MLKLITTLAVLLSASTVLADSKPIDVCMRIDAKTLECTHIEAGQKPVVYRISTAK